MVAFDKKPFLATYVEYFLEVSQQGKGAAGDNSSGKETGGQVRARLRLLEQRENRV